MATERLNDIKKSNFYKHMFLKFFIILFYFIFFKPFTLSMATLYKSWYVQCYPLNSYATLQTTIIKICSKNLGIFLKIITPYKVTKNKSLYYIK